MKARAVNYIISIIFIIGIFGAGNLTYHEFLQEGACPKLGIIPACYIVLACFVIPFIAHIFNTGRIVYFLFTGFALALAIYASIGQLFGNLQCPKAESGIPMCYISFVIFASLVLLKIIVLKKRSFYIN
jgi:hypothetical protein